MVVLVGVTIPFWLLDIDISLQSLFFRNGGWPLDAHPLVQLLYRYGSLPGLVLAAGAVVILVRGGNSARSLEWRRAGAALLLTLVIGPGLMVNAVSKKYTGRPRPREISVFGGSWEYRQVLDFGTPGRGQSFPAGHPSMGFLFFSFYFSFRRKRRGIARAALAMGGVYGGLVGFGRIVQGAHFLSDVVWSGGMTLIAARTAHFLTADQGEGSTQSSWWGKKRTRPVSIAIGICMIALLAGAFILGAPYYSETRFSWDPGNPPALLVLNLDRARIRIRSDGRNGGVIFKSRGFAPKSSYYMGEFSAGPDCLVLRSRRSGFFAELTADVELVIPPDGVDTLMIRCGRGDVYFSLSTPIKRVYIETGEGHIAWRGSGRVADAVIRNANGGILFAGSRLPDHLTVMAPRGTAELTTGFFKGDSWITGGDETLQVRTAILETPPAQICVKARGIISTSSRIRSEGDR